MRPDPPIFAQPREISNECPCRWENVRKQGGTMRLAELGRGCPNHTTDPDVSGRPDIYKRGRSCPCVSVPTGVGWTWRLIEIAPDCAYHRSVVLGARDVAPWAAKKRK